MKTDKRVIMSIIWLVIGLILIGFSFAGKVDEFWNGRGTALAVIGAIQLLRFYRFCKNEAYREAVRFGHRNSKNVDIHESGQKQQKRSRKEYLYTSFYSLNGQK